MTAKQQEALRILEQVIEVEQTEDDIRMIEQGFKYHQGQNFTCYNLSNLKVLLLEIFNDTNAK